MKIPQVYSNVLERVAFVLDFDNICLFCRKKNGRKRLFAVNHRNRYLSIHVIKNSLGLRVKNDGKTIFNQNDFLNLKNDKQVSTRMTSKPILYNLSSVGCNLFDFFFIFSLDPKTLIFLHVNVEGTFFPTHVK